MKANKALELTFDSARKDIDDIYRKIEDATKLGKLYIVIDEMPDMVWHSLKKDGYQIQEFSTGPVKYMYTISWE